MMPPKLRMQYGSAEQNAEMDLMQIDQTILRAGVQEKAAWAKAEIIGRVGVLAAVFLMLLAYRYQFFWSEMAIPGIAIIMVFLTAGWIGAGRDFEIAREVSRLPGWNLVLVFTLVRAAERFTGLGIVPEDMSFTLSSVTLVALMGYMIWAAVSLCRNIESTLYLRQAKTYLAKLPRKDRKIVVKRIRNNPLFAKATAE